jgi:hypothetical protein
MFIGEREFEQLAKKAETIKILFEALEVLVPAIGFRMEKMELLRVTLQRNFPVAIHFQRDTRK